MGIRYYAYAFDNHQTQAALTDPHTFISSDPLADAWGFEPHARVARPSFEQSVPERDMLYLDKAWRPLQALTNSSEVRRPAYCMFEGDVAMREGGWTWDPWIRVLTPSQVRHIELDLRGRTGDTARRQLEERVSDDDVDYAMHYLDRARRFVEDLAWNGRGMVYTIR